MTLYQESQVSVIIVGTKVELYFVAAKQSTLPGEAEAWEMIGWRADLHKGKSWLTIWRSENLSQRWKLKPILFWSRIPPFLTNIATSEKTKASPSLHWLQMRARSQQDSNGSAGKPRWILTPDPHTSKKRKSLRSLLPSPKYFAEKVRKSEHQNFAKEVRKSWN